MIGRICGELIEKTPGQALVDCGGLGYEVDIPYTTFFHLPETGQAVTLHTHFAVREDAHNLFGFASRLDRDLFRLLIRVNGVGPKLALTILSGLDARQFVQCVDNKDASALVKIPGVGKKTAERLVMEMGDKLGSLEGTGDAQVSLEAVRPEQPVSQGERPGEEAEAALIALGYRPQEAAKALSQVDGEGHTSQELIRLALRNMMA
ncbi:Holliday junction DNA helicase subunit RuvA [Tamilnaduibacter salinus]|uniref:Holliday junction branch migration complex subunit RuvA n=1 Tax=Tamilnaduibacter salinus TaxID=1484056 RepID=A0A2A2I7D8_9GAMM|nr:Holliday junction branch migration protein RuvA [Tamilnaduibacter salinus]PAV26953.1 Holliday junction branch migration protein RuvA [Tamilnaduibacter salinus]PVY78358.1 Holliday junction DNA helicase subunit RuvA [Tamilnaduibacter salinus]